MSTTTCSLPRCTGDFYALDLCETHYNKQRRLRELRGDADKISTEPALLHALMLRRRGWTWKQIATAAKSSTMTLGRIERGEQPTLRRDKVNRILVIQPTWQRTNLAIPMLGTRRRLDALAWQGWSNRAVSRELGLCEWTIRNTWENKKISAAVAAQIADFYDAHVNKPGPDPVYAKKARTLGAIPAAAWEGDIDDPNLQPEGIAAADTGRRSAAVLVEDFDYLVSAGLSEDQAAAQLGIKPDSIGNARKRVKVSAARKAQTAARKEEAA